MTKFKNQICKIKSQANAVDSHNFAHDDDDNDDDAVVLANKIYIL